MKVFFKMKKLFTLLLGKLYYGNARPAAYDIRNFIAADFRRGGLLFTFPVGVEFVYLLLNTIHFFNKLLRLRIIFALCRLVFFKGKTF